MKKIPLLLALLTTLSSSHAQLYVDIVEKGSDVVATAHGSIDISALTIISSTIGPPRIYPSLASITFETLNSSTNWAYGSINGPSSFGLSGQTNGTASPGNDTLNFTGSSHLTLSRTYKSGDPLYAVVTFPGTTIASLQMTNGSTYTWNWGGLTSSESIIMRVGTTATPTVLVYDFPDTIRLGDSINVSLKSSAFTGINPLVYSLSGNVPAGVSISGDQIVGTPTTPGTYAFTVTGADDEDSASVSLSLTVLEASLSVSGFPATITLGESINGTLHAQHFDGSVTYSLSGDVPDGISISGDQIVGTPTTPGTYAFTVTATDGTDSASSNLSLTVGSTESYQLYANTESYQFYTLNENAIIPEPVSYSVIGTLPRGLRIADGALQGVTPDQGTYTFSIQLSNGIYQKHLNYTLEVMAPTLQPIFTGITLNGNFQPTTLLESSTHTRPAETALYVAAVPVNETLEFAFSWDFIKGDFSYRIVGGSLPPGLSLNGETGLLSGIPTKPGSFTFVVSVKDWRGRAFQWIQLEVQP